MHPKAKKRIAVLALAVGVVAVAGGSLFAYRKLSVRAEFAALRSEGLAAAEAGNHKEAFEKLARYLFRSPNDVQVLVAFARSREQVPAPGGAHLRQARDAYQRAVSLDRSLIDQRARLAMLMSDFGQLPEALEQADRVLAVRPEDRTALAVRAVVLQRMRRPADAAAAALRWSEVAPEDVRSLAIALATARDNGATPEALKELAGSLEARAKDDKGLAVIRGTMALLTADGEAARRWWREAAKFDAGSAEEASFIADQLQNVRLPVESAEYLVRAAEQGKLRSGKLIPARRLLELERYDLLSRLLEEVRAEDEQESAEMLAMRAISLAGTGKLTEAQPFLDALGRRDNSAGRGWKLITQLALGQAEDDAEQTRKVLENAAREGEGAPMLSLVLADAMARQGETERAVRMFESLGEASTGWSRPLERKAHYLSTMGQLESAFQTAVEAARRAPRDPRALTTLARVWSSAVEAGVVSNRAELVQFLQELSAMMPADQSTAPVRIITFARAGRMNDARAVADQVVAAARENPSPAWGGLLVRVATAAATVGLGNEISLIDVAEELGGVTPMSALTRAFLELGTEPPASVVSRFEEKRKTEGPEAREWAVAWANLLDNVGDPRAVAAWTSLSEAYPQDLAIQRDVVTSRAARENLDLRRAAIERLRALAGEASTTFRLADAQLALDTPGSTPQRLTEVADRLLEIVRVTPGNVQARILLARVQERMGNTAQAIEQLRAVPANVPESVPSLLMLAELLQRNGDFAGAERVLEQALARGAMGENQLRGAAMLLAEQGDARKALDLLRRGSDQRPDPMRVQLYRQANDLARAEAEALRVVEASPDVFSIRTLAEIQRARGNVAAATATLARLDGLTLPPGLKELSLADYHLRFLELGAARQQAQRATEAAPENPVGWQALVTVQAAMGDINGALETIDRAAARLPNVAMFTAQRQRSELIRSAARDPVLVAVVVALLQSPNDEALVEAISTPTSGAIAEGGPSAAAARIKALAERHPQSQPVQMLAVRRMVQLSQPEEAARIAARAAQSFPTSTEAPALGATAFATASDWPQAVAMARLWRERSAANPLPADLALSEALIKVGRLEEAAAVVEPYVRGFSEDPQAYLPALFRRAEIFSLANQDDRAAQTLAPVLAGKPATWIQWLSYVAERLTPEHVIRWAARAEAAPEGRDPIVVWQAALVRANALTALNAPSAPRARETLVELAAAEGRGGEYLASAALAFDQANDLTNAERLYRQAMAAGINGLPVRNNLAMVLARKGGDMTEALAMAQGVVNEAGAVAAFVDTLGSVQAAAGDFAAAEQTLTRAVNLEPANVEWWIHLAEIQHKGGKAEAAAATTAAVAFVRPESLSEGLRGRLLAIRAATAAPPAR